MDYNQRDQCFTDRLTGAGRGGVTVVSLLRPLGTGTHTERYSRAGGRRRLAEMLR